MNFKLYFSKNDKNSCRLGVILAGLLMSFTIGLIVNTLVVELKKLSLLTLLFYLVAEFFSLYSLISGLVHIIKSQYPYAILDEQCLVVRQMSKPFNKIILKLPYSEIILYSTLVASSQDQIKCSVINIGSLDPQYSVALRCENDIYFISVEQPFEFCKELSFRIDEANRKARLI